MICRAFFLALIFLAITVGASQADNPTTLADYRRAVAQSLDLVERAANESIAAQRAPLLKQAADLLGAIHVVATDTGEPLTVNNANLIADLNNAAPELDRVKNARARLQSLRAALDDLPRAANETDRAKLRDILNRPPFKTNAVENPLNQLLQQISAWLERLLGNAVTGVFNLRDVILLFGFILIAGILVYFMHGLAINLAPEAQAPTDDSAETPLTATSAFAHAQQFTKQGDYRSAVRQLYLATILLLDERGLLRYDRALTNREYLRAVAREPQVLAALQPIVETFDRTWYGFESISREDFEAYQKQVDAVRKL